MTKEIVDLTIKIDFELPLTCMYLRPMKLRKIGGTFVENKKYRTTRFGGITIRSNLVFEKNFRLNLMSSKFM